MMLDIDRLVLASNHAPVRGRRLLRVSSKSLGRGSRGLFAGLAGLMLVGCNEKPLTVLGRQVTADNAPSLVGHSIRVSDVDCIITGPDFRDCEFSDVSAGAHFSLQPERLTGVPVSVYMHHGCEIVLTPKLILRDGRETRVYADDVAATCPPQEEPK